MKRFGILFGLILSMLAQRSAGEAISLKELAGENFIEVTHDAKQTITLAGQPSQKTDTHIAFVFKLTPAKSDAAGQFYDVTILKCDDSSKAGDAAETKGTFKGFAGKKFQMLVAPGQKSVEFHDSDHLVGEVFGAEAAGANADQMKFYGDIVRGVLRMHLADAFLPLPDKAVSEGDTWRHLGGMKIQPFAELVMDREYKVSGTETKDGQSVRVIKWASKIEIKPMTDDKGVLPFKVTEMKTNGDSDDAGTIYWDTQANRPARVETQSKYSMAMTMQIQKTEMKGTGTGTDVCTYRYLAADPTK